MKAACEAIGLELMEGQTKYQCWGTGKSLSQLESYQRMSNKKLMPEGFTLGEMGQCEHAIRAKRKTGHYEIGLTKRKDGRAGWLLHCDISGALAIKECAGADLGKLKQGYSVEVAIRAAKRAGFRVVKREIRTDGSVAIVTQR